MLLSSFNEVTASTVHMVLCMIIMLLGFIAKSVKFYFDIL